MLPMYEVYSMTRAGRPRWALLATGVLLVLTTLVAWGVAGHRRAGSAIELGEPKLYPELGLRAALPEDWEIGKPERLADGRVLVCESPQGQADRQVILLRLRPPTLTSRNSRLAVLADVLGLGDPDAAIANQQSLGAGTLGGLPSQRWALQVVYPSSDQVRIALLNLATSGEGHWIGVSVMCDGQPSPSDQRLLEKVSKAVGVEKLGRGSGGRPEPVDDAPEPGDDDLPASRPLVSRFGCGTTPILRETAS
jgi:hypothetical protein